MEEKNTDTVKLLQTVHKGCEMGIVSLSKLDEKIKQGKVNDTLDYNLAQYREICGEAKKQLAVCGVQEKDINKMLEMMAKAEVNMKTMMDDSDSAVAEMMIQGSTMGITEMTKSLNKYKDADAKSRELARKLLQTEQNSIEKWKAYL